MHQELSACLLLYLSPEKSGEWVSSCQQEKWVTVNNKGPMGSAQGIVFHTDWKLFSSVQEKEK